MPGSKIQSSDAASNRTLLTMLAKPTRRFIDDTLLPYRLTFQETRRLCEIARDLDMWQVPGLEEQWRRLEPRAPSRWTSRQRKKHILEQLEYEVGELRRQPTVYPEPGLRPPARQPLRLVREDSEKTILGDCPVASEKTLCCNLKTIDAVENCGFGCSYCTIQTFYRDNAVLDSRFADKLKKIKLDRERAYHITTGQSSDSLLWGNAGGVLDELCDFAARHPNVILELKTKSANVGYFMEYEVPRNIVCAWSLNTDTIVRNEEHFTASLDERLKAARRVADRGIRVGFHFHPIVHYDRWARDYADLAQQLVGSFRPAEVAFVSMGSVTLIRPVLREIRKRGEPTRILQNELVPDPHGKLTYPDDLKIRLFRRVYRALGPWHGTVFMYLCMERADFWDAVFGRRYSSNELFEADFASSVQRKIGAAVTG